MLTMTPNAERTGVVCGIEADMARDEGSAVRRRERDKRIGAGTMSRSGVQCHLCPAIMTMEDLRLAGRAGRLGEVMTAVVVDGPKGKEHRLPTERERQAARVERADLDRLYAEIPFGLPEEPTPSEESLGRRVPHYSFDTWWTLFTNRQILSLGTFVQEIRRLPEAMADLPDPAPIVRNKSAASPQDAAATPGFFDLICTDPLYYDAIPYSDLIDFFHVWLRRAIRGLTPELDAVCKTPLGPKWDTPTNDGELIDDAGRFGGDREASKRNYEDGMARAFSRFHAAVRDNGRLVVVFANKSPAAGEALIRADFVTHGSWPIRTEMETRQRSLSSAALASSIWIVCRKRSAARAGWGAGVLAEMRENISQQLHDFWDAGIRGPDLAWAATGPALEAFSKYPVVKKADAAGSQMTVSESLREVRRFVVGRVLTHDGDAEATSGLDDVTTYYLLHRNDSGLDEAPIGACILYAISGNLSDRHPDRSLRHSVPQQSHEQRRADSR